MSRISAGKSVRHGPSKAGSKGCSGARDWRIARRSMPATPNENATNRDGERRSDSGRSESAPGSLATSAQISVSFHVARKELSRIRDGRVRCPCAAPRVASGKASADPSRPIGRRDAPSASREAASSACSRRAKPLQQAVESTGFARKSDAISRFRDAAAIVFFRHELRAAARSRDIEPDRPPPEGARAGVLPRRGGIGSRTRHWNRSRPCRLAPFTAGSSGSRQGAPWH